MQALKGKEIRRRTTVALRRCHVYSVQALKNQDAEGFFRANAALVLTQVGMMEIGI